MAGNRKQNEQFSFHNLDQLWSAIVIDQMVKSGIDQFFISPGLRNLPLVDAIYQNPNTRHFISIDERAAAFAAQGYAKETQKPAVVICTSGSALANYFPAVIEAYKSNTPLIILSADRPAHEVLFRGNQTMPQQDIFQSFTTQNFDLGPSRESLSPRQLAATICRLISDAGVIHINFPLREIERNEAISTSYLQMAQELLEQNSPAIQLLTQLNTVLKILGTNPLVVMGNTPSPSQLLPSLRSLRCPLLVDITSSLKFQLAPQCLPHLDALKSRPSGVLHLGGKILNKEYYDFLQKNPTLPVVVACKQWEHPAELITHYLAMDEITAAQKLLLHWQGQPPCYREDTAKIARLISDYPLSSPAVAQKIIQLISADETLYLGNSSVVRNFDFCALLAESKNIKVITNRGISGIDGPIASACGASISNKQRTTLVLGDISFIHDLNSLSLCQELPITIIVINNKKGGIFEQLPALENKILPKAIITPHSWEFSQIAAQFSIPYHRITKLDDLEKIIPTIKQNALIEIIIDNQQDLQLNKKLRGLL